MTMRLTVIAAGVSAVTAQLIASPVFLDGTILGAIIAQSTSVSNTSSTVTPSTSLVAVVSSTEPATLADPSVSYSISSPDLTSTSTLISTSSALNTTASTKVSRHTRTSRSIHHRPSRNAFSHSLSRMSLQIPTRIGPESLAPNFTAISSGVSTLSTQPTQTGRHSPGSESNASDELQSKNRASHHHHTVAREHTTTSYNYLTQTFPGVMNPIDGITTSLPGLADDNYFPDTAQTKFWTSKYRELAAHKRSNVPTDASATATTTSVADACHHSASSSRWNQINWYTPPCSATKISQSTFPSTSTPETSTMATKGDVAVQASEKLAFQRPVAHKKKKQTTTVISSYSTLIRGTHTIIALSDTYVLATTTGVPFNCVVC